VEPMLLPRKPAAGAEGGSLEPGHALSPTLGWRAVSLPQASAATSRLTGLPLLFGGCVYYSEPRSRKASGLPDCGGRPMRRSGPCSLWGGGGPSALPVNLPQRWGLGKAWAASLGTFSLQIV
jgi:hypothetical protein